MVTAHFPITKLKFLSLFSFECEYICHHGKRLQSPLITDHHCIYTKCIYTYIYTKCILLHFAAQECVHCCECVCDLFFPILKVEVAFN